MAVAVGFAAADGSIPLSMADYAPSRINITYTFMPSESPAFCYLKFQPLRQSGCERPNFKVKMT